MFVLLLFLLLLETCFVSTYVYVDLRTIRTIAHIMSSHAQFCPVMPSYTQLCPVTNSNNRTERLNTCTYLCSLPVSVNRFYLKFSDTKFHVNPLEYFGIRYMRTETETQADGQTIMDQMIVSELKKISDTF